jgi:uncharacterized membrane protein YedE/YeeE
MKILSALLCGTLFGFGLALSGMTDTAKVTGFLDVYGDWIPDLAFVMGGAVMVTVVAFRFILRRPLPILDASFHVPGESHIDRQLAIGAVLFGVGWGLYGYCPGPAIAALAYLDWQAGLFVLSMLAGMSMVDPVKDRSAWIH